MNRSEGRRVIAVTYVGSARFGFYKDCGLGAERLRQSLDDFGIPLIIYSFRDLRELVRFPNSNFFYFFTRYGAGAWFWKPTLMLDALNKDVSADVIYFDADCAINRDPRDLVAKNLENHDIALFRQNSNLIGWISGRAVKILGLNTQDLLNTELLTAGVVVLKNSINSRRFLNAWGLGMKNPRVLLHPAFQNKRVRHRHDQAVLSVLISKGDFKCKIMSTGFYSSGAESLEANVQSAWVYTGEVEKRIDHLSLKTRISLLSDYYSRKVYDLVKSVLVTPIHLLFFHTQKSTLKTFSGRKIE